MAGYQDDRLLDKLRHSLKLQFGTSAHELNHEQLRQILRDIEKIQT